MSDIERKGDIRKYTASIMGKRPALADTGQTPPPLPPQRPINNVYYAQQQPKSGMNTTCLVLAIIIPCVAIAMIAVLGILAAIMLPALARAREAAHKASCQNNLKQMGLIIMMYSNDDANGYWPALDPAAQDFVMDSAPLFPEYMADASIMKCPSDPSVDTTTSYYYFGYLLTTEDEMLAFLESYPDSLESGTDFSQDLPAPEGRGSCGGNTFVRLREGLERTMNFSPASVPVMFDMINSSGQGMMRFNHLPGGSNVLFMDGHVEFIEYPSKFPITPAIVEVFSP